METVKREAGAEAPDCEPLAASKPIVKSETIFTATTSSLIRIELTVKNTQFEALVDSGATISLINPSLADRLLLHTIPVNPVNFRFANNTNEIVQNGISAPVRFQNQNKEHLFRVSPTLPVDCLLGLDFLKSFHLVIRCREAGITVDADDAECYSVILNETCPAINPRVRQSTVKLCEDITIAPNTCQKVKVRCDTVTAGVAIVEQHELNAARFKLQFGPAACFFSNKEALLMITNTNSYPVRLFRNTNVGFIDGDYCDIDVTGDSINMLDESDDCDPSITIDVNEELPPDEQSALREIAVYGTELTDHLTNLQKVFDAIRNANLKFELKKCSLGYKTIKFLGMMVTKDGLRPDSEKVRAVQEMPEPHTATQVRQFLGLTSYYRRFVKDYASNAHPLYQLVTSQTSITLNAEARAAFETLKAHLVSEPIIVIFNTDLPIFIHCDGSK